MKYKNTYMHIGKINGIDNYTTLAIDFERTVIYLIKFLPKKNTVNYNLASIDAIHGLENKLHKKEADINPLGGIMM